MGKPQGCLLHGFHTFIPADAETTDCDVQWHVHTGGPTDRPLDTCRSGAETAGEPEAPECPRCKGSAIDPEHSYPDVVTPGEEEPGWLEPCIACQQPPRRPPYAVAYAVEGGTEYEVALPGDATVRAVDGALVVTHSRPVLAMTIVRPMGAEEGA